MDPPAHHPNYSHTNVEEEEYLVASIAATTGTTTASTGRDAPSATTTTRSLGATQSSAITFNLALDDSDEEGQEEEEDGTSTVATGTVAVVTGDEHVNVQDHQEQQQRLQEEEQAEMDRMNKNYGATTTGTSVPPLAMTTLSRRSTGFTNTSSPRVASVTASSATGTSPRASSIGGARTIGAINGSVSTLQVVEPSCIVLAHQNSSGLRNSANTSNNANANTSTNTSASANSSVSGSASTPSGGSSGNTANGMNFTASASGEGGGTVVSNLTCATPNVSTPPTAFATAAHTSTRPSKMGMGLATPSCIQTATARAVSEPPNHHQNPNRRSTTNTTMTAQTSNVARRATGVAAAAQAEQDLIAAKYQVIQDCTAKEAANSPPLVRAVQVQHHREGLYANTTGQNNSMSYIGGLGEDSNHGDSNNHSKSKEMSVQDYANSNHVRTPFSSADLAKNPNLTPIVHRMPHTTIVASQGDSTNPTTVVEQREPKDEEAYMNGAASAPGIVQSCVTHPSIRHHDCGQSEQTSTLGPTQTNNTTNTIKDGSASAALDATERTSASRHKDDIFQDDQSNTNTNQSDIEEKQRSKIILGTSVGCCLLLTLVVIVVAVLMTTGGTQDGSSNNANNSNNTGAPPPPITTVPVSTITQAPTTMEIPPQVLEMLFPPTAAPIASESITVPTSMPTTSTAAEATTTSPSFSSVATTADESVPTEDSAGVTTSAPVPQFDWLPDYTLSALETDTTWTSPQALALEWLSDHPDLVTLESWRQQQLFAMVTFYYAMNGNTLWGTLATNSYLDYTIPECQWGEKFGNQCSDEGKLTQLSLDDLELTLASGASSLLGNLPAEMALLTDLEALEVERNAWRHPAATALPAELSSLKSLTDISFNENQLYGPLPLFSGATGFTGVRGLDLSLNEITGPLPPGMLLSLKGLENLNLRSNQITGSLPTEIGMLSNLQHLTLYENKFTGTLPSELGLLTRLESLTIYSNSFSGTIPVKVCQLLTSSQALNIDGALVCPVECACGRSERHLRGLLD